MKQNNNYIHLDFMRGMAAILVMIGHLRSYLYVGFSDLESQSITARLFYLITGFGTIAVIIFFVLSGFFITKSVVGMTERNTWNWGDYLVRRVSRLWMVLIPALLLTYFWDSLGMMLTGSGYYSGEYIENYSRGPAPEDGVVNLSAETFLANLFFLGGIEAPFFGTNLPLWSLAYEFWYYILFPLAFIPFAVKKSLTYKVTSLSLFVVLVWWLPPYLLKLGIAWLFGAVVYKLHTMESVRNIFSKPLVAIAMTGLFLMAVIATRFNANVMMYLVVAFFTSTFILSIVMVKINIPFYESTSTFFANMSYTLYLVHDSFLAFIACYLLQNQQSHFTSIGMVIFGELVFITMVYGFIVYWLFERNTHLLKGQLQKLIPKQGAQVKPQIRAVL